MSKFSEKCKKLMEANGSNVYRLSQTSALERTSLQRMVTGKRLPNQEFVRAFCRALRIPAAEEKELMELYTMESMGETAYRNQRTMLQLFQHLVEVEKEEKPSCKMEPQNNLVLTSPISGQSYNTELLLQFLLKDAFQGENHTIYTNLPGTDAEFFQYLHLFALQYMGKTVVKHLITFRISDTDIYENLESLNEVLPLYFADAFRYEPRYYYSTLSAKEQSDQIYSYYVISSKYVLQLSGDLKKGILHSDPWTVQQYTEEFLEKFSQSTPLIGEVSSREEIKSMVNVFCFLGQNDSAEISGAPMNTATSREYTAKTVHLSRNFLFPRSVNIELYDQQILCIQYIGRKQKTSLAVIQENSICQMFAEFFQKLENAEYIYPEEESGTLVFRYTKLKEKTV